MATHSPITIARFWTKVRAPSEFQCWTWDGRTNDKGYGRFDDGTPAHRWAYEYFNGPIPKGLLVLHSCDNPPCCNPRHLRAGTHQENMDDAVKRGRMHRGRHCHNVKVTEADVDYIRRNPDGLTLREIAAKFGIGKSTASYIRSGRSWKAQPVVGEAGIEPATFRV